MATRTYYRNENDPKGWWHWRDECAIFQAKGDSKENGDTWVTMESDTHPTTYALCPGCLAEDERRRTKSQAVYVNRKLYPSVTNQLTDGIARRGEPVSTP